MNKETLDLLKDLAAKLGTTADHLWSVMIRQARVSFVMDLVLDVMAGLALYIIVKAVRACVNADSKDKEGGAGIILIVVLSVVGFFIVLAVVLNLPDTITKVANPEYWALQQILETVKGVK